MGIKVQKLRTNNIDRIVATYDEIVEISKKLSEKDCTGIAPYVVEMFSEIMVVLEPDGYDKLNAMSKLIGNRELRKQAIVMKRENGKFTPYTGWFSNETLEYEENKLDNSLLENGVMAIAYLYMMSQVNDENNSVSYDESITIDKYENKVATMKKVGKRTVRKINVISRKSIKLNALKMDCRAYNRLAESWNVRGHWREYKNGNRVWIKGYVKGSGEKTVKEYKI